MQAMPSHDTAHAMPVHVAVHMTVILTWTHDDGLTSDGLTVHAIGGGDQAALDLQMIQVLPMLCPTLLYACSA